jgi:hypothetical protein
MSMRAVLCIPVLTSCLLLLSCGGPGSKAKAPGELKAPDVIVGKWDGKKDEGGLNSYIVDYEFGADNTVTVTCLNAKEPIKGKYKFANDYTLEMEYEATDEAKKVYAEAARAYKTTRREAAAKDNGGQVPPQILGPMQGMFARIPDELPAKEKLTINVRPVPAGSGKDAPSSPAIEMVLTNEKNFLHVFRKRQASE